MITRIKQRIVDWLGISHMAADVYGKLLREHENRVEKRMRDALTQAINQIMEQNNAHCGSEDNIHDTVVLQSLAGAAYGALDEDAGVCVRKAFAIADKVIQQRRCKQELLVNKK